MKSKMTKILAGFLAVLMLLSVVAILASAEGETPVVYKPELLFTKVCPDTSSAQNNVGAGANYGQDTANKNWDVYEMYEIYNNSDHDVNLYEYGIAYQGDKATKSYFQGMINEFTPFAGGLAWITDASKAKVADYNDKYVVPENPATAVIKPGECVVLWSMYSETYKAGVTMANFREFWGIAPETLVLHFDGNGDDNLNFNIKNSNTGTYIIVKATDAMKKFDQPNNAAELDLVATADVVSWVCVDFLLKAGDTKVFTYKSNNTNVFCFKYDTTNPYSYALNAQGKRVEYLETAAYGTVTPGKLTAAQQATMTNNDYLASLNQPVVTTEEEVTTEGAPETTLESTEGETGLPGTPDTGDSSVLVAVLALVAVLGAGIVIVKKVRA